MTATIASIPLTLGGMAARTSGRACLWGLEHFVRSPMAVTGLILVSGLTLMAGTNALFMQEGRHPAPWFSTRAVQPVVIEPETIPVRPAVVETSATPSTPTAPQPTVQTASRPEPVQQTAEQSQADDSVVIGNQDIAVLQEKLKALGFFGGTVDGYYGPKTADAIRAFETQAGLPRTGAASPDLIQAVKNAPLTTSQAQAPAQPQPLAAEPASEEIAPLLNQMQTEALPQPAEDDRVVADVAPQTIQPGTDTIQVAEAQIPAALDTDLVSDIQRGLSRLGFLQGPVTGIADEATARAIRKFQIFNDYAPTGEVSANMREMLVTAGAYL